MFSKEKWREYNFFKKKNVKLKVKTYESIFFRTTPKKIHKGVFLYIYLLPYLPSAPLLSLSIPF